MVHINSNKTFGWRSQFSDSKTCARSLRALALAGTMLGFAATAHAQTAEPATDGGDIIVTATRRDTRLIDTPIAITAIGGDTLERQGVRGLNDLARLAPGLNLEDRGGGFTRITLRGIRAPGEPTVGLYYDEAPITGTPGSGGDPGSSAANLRLFDVDRVEVLRGPQGTLFGSGSMGGTVRVIFAKPTYDYEGTAQGEIATTAHGGERYQLQGMANVPIVDGKVALRTVLYYVNDGGYIDNVPLGIRNIDSSETWGGRALLRLDPTETLSIDLAAYIERGTGNKPTLTGRDYTSSIMSREPYRDAFNLYSGTANWDVGAATVTATTAYYRRKQTRTIDASDSVALSYGYLPDCQFYNGGTACGPDALAGFNDYIDGITANVLRYPTLTTNWTGELRVSSNGNGPFKWTVGGYFERRRSDVVSEEILTDPVTGRIVVPNEVLTSRYVNDDLDQKALFGEVSYDLLPNLTATAGARLFDYKRIVGGATTVAWPVYGITEQPYVSRKSSESGVVTKFNLSYKPVDGVLLYATASQGFRPGGGNQSVGLPDRLLTYDSDSLWNYELGAKTQLLGNRLTISADVFQIDWADMQVRGTNASGYAFVSNAGDARIRGIEAEFGARPVAGLELNGNLTWMDPKLSEDQINEDVVAAGRKGDRIPYIPKLTAMLGAQYTMALAPETDLTLRVDANYVGRSYSEFRPTSSNRREIGDYVVANTRATFDLREQGLSVYAFVDNLFDKFGTTYARSEYLTGYVTQYNIIRPRTVGLGVQKSF